VPASPVWQGGRTVTLEEWQEQGRWTVPGTVSRQVADRSPACAGAPHLAGDANDRAINLGAINARTAP